MYWGALSGNGALGGVEESDPVVLSAVTIHNIPVDTKEINVELWQCSATPKRVMGSIYSKNAKI